MQQNNGNGAVVVNPQRGRVLGRVEGTTQSTRGFNLLWFVHR
jgi:hypothetical protein